MSTNFIFANEDKKHSNLLDKDPWRVLIVDDEEDVHVATKLSLNDFIFENRSLELIHAYSGKEAAQIIADNPDITLVLLDVVMENDHSGLELVKTIRNELKNSWIRIVLRTGQPGQAPEHTVVRDYDINDYKYKPELTSGKLHTLCYSNLRAYRDIQTLLKSKKGLEKLIVASRGISSRQALNNFVYNTLQQLMALLNLDDTSLFTCETDAFKIVDKDLEIFVSENNKMLRKHVKINDLPTEKRDLIRLAIKERKNIVKDNRLVMYCANANDTILFFARVESKLSDLDTSLISIFTENLVVILENIRLNELVEDSQREINYCLGEVIESRSNETGNHVKRVAHYSALLAKLVGLTENEIEMIKLASPLHDIGKIGIPDAILQKPGKLDKDEWEVMKTHAQKGYELLKDSKLAIMKVGSEIAYYHHERWDGNGYPNGLSKNEIPIYGRITSLADVFDALGSPRCYKKAWPDDEVLAHIKEQSGKQFDPRLTQLFLENISQFLEIRDKFVD